MNFISGPRFLTWAEEPFSQELFRPSLGNPLVEGCLRRKNGSELYFRELLGVSWRKQARNKADFPVLQEMKMEYYLIFKNNV